MSCSWKLLATLVAATAVGLAPTGTTAEPSTAEGLSVSELSLQVAALRAVNDLQLTPEQMKKWRDLAAQTAPKKDDRKPGKASSAYRKVLTDLREALLKEDAAGRAAELEGKRDALNDKE